MFELDYLHLSGNVAGGSWSPYRIINGLDMSPSARKYQWAESEYSSGANLFGEAPQGNVERTLPLRIYSRFTSAYTNLATNPRLYADATGWSAAGTVGSSARSTADYRIGPASYLVTTNGNNNTGGRFAFTATAAAYSAGMFVNAPAGASMKILFDGGTGTTFTGTGAWQWVTTTNVTLTAATRYIEIRQQTASSQSFYIGCPMIVLGATCPDYFDGATGDARWTGAAWTSPSTCLTGQDAISRAVGALADKAQKAKDKAGQGGINLDWKPHGSTYRNAIDCRAVDIGGLAYDNVHISNQRAQCEVRLTCHPYCKGPEYTAHTGSAVIGATSYEGAITDVKGDVPGPCRVKITPGPNFDQRFAVYGLQGRDYVSGTSLDIGATSFGLTGSSGALTAATTEVQTLTKTGTISGGSFTWASIDVNQTTVAIAYNATAATATTALETIFGSGNVTVTGGPISTATFTVTFGGALAGKQITALTVNSSLTGGGSVAQATTVEGFPAYVKADLFDEWTTICDTGNLSLVGSYDVWARVYDAGTTSEIGDAQLRLVHGAGDLGAVATNDSASPAAVGGLCLVNLGQIHIDPATTGTQRYKTLVEGRTDGTAGNDMRVTQIMYFPRENGYGRVEAVNSTTSVLSALDDFSLITGAITGATSVSGQTWASAGGLTDPDDFTETAAPNNAVIRTAVSDTATDIRHGRAVLLGAGTPTNVTVSVVLAGTTAKVATRGVIARFVDNNNFLAAVVDHAAGIFAVYKVLGGVVSSLGALSLTGSGDSSRLAITATAAGSGAWSASIDATGSLFGVDSSLMGGSGLASGKSGIIDWSPSAAADTRTYSNFKVSTHGAEQVAAYAAQALEFREDTAIRESSAGDYYSTPSLTTVTRQPLLVPEGSDGLTNRILIDTARFNPNLAGDTFGDAFGVEVLHTPCYALARSES